MHAQVTCRLLDRLFREDERVVRVFRVLCVQKQTCMCQSQCRILHAQASGQRQASQRRSAGQRHILLDSGRQHRGCLSYWLCAFFASPATQGGLASLGRRGWLLQSHWSRRGCVPGQDGPDLGAVRSVCCEQGADELCRPERHIPFES